MTVHLMGKHNLFFIRESFMYLSVSLCVELLACVCVCTTDYSPRREEQVMRHGTLALEL
jgi:hypothetical protein